jgi:hypothetical protein
MGNMKHNKHAQELEILFRQEFIHNFPYPDCRKLQKLHPRIARQLVPDLDMYFSFIAGYSSSATRLDQRPQRELRAAVPKLRRSFSDWYPRYKQLAMLITDVNTPLLSHDLKVADQLRGGLLTFITELL